MLTFAFTGELTARWRELNARQVEADAAERDRQVGGTVRLSRTDRPAQSDAVGLRSALSRFLSGNQRQLLSLLHLEAREERYSSASSLIGRYDLKEKGWTARSVQETLDLFEQTGLVHRVNAVIRAVSRAAEEAVSTVAYRPIAEEDRATEDAELLGDIATAE